eukprot:3193026-Amphidinium_carterae.6
MRQFGQTDEQDIAEEHADEALQSLRTALSGKVIEQPNSGSASSWQGAIPPPPPPPSPEQQDVQMDTAGTNDDEQDDDDLPLTSLLRAQDRRQKEDDEVQIISTKLGPHQVVPVLVCGTVCVPFGWTEVMIGKASRLSLDLLGLNTDSLGIEVKLLEHLARADAKFVRCAFQSNSAMQRLAALSGALDRAGLSALAGMVRKHTEGKQGGNDSAPVTEEDDRRTVTAKEQADTVPRPITEGRPDESGTELDIVQRVKVLELWAHQCDIISMLRRLHRMCRLLFPCLPRL